MAARGVRPRLTTKTFNPMEAGADHGLNPDRVARQLRSSLDRLGVGHVELYLAHEYDPDVPLAETFGAFGTAQADGLIGAYGVSNFDAPQPAAPPPAGAPPAGPAAGSGVSTSAAPQLAAARAAGAPRAVQNSYSLLARQDEPDLLPLCAARGVAYLAFGPLAGGWLTGKYRRGAADPRESTGGARRPRRGHGCPGGRSRTRTSSPAPPSTRWTGWRRSPPPAAPHWPDWRSAGCWPTSGGPRACSGRAARSTWLRRPRPSGIRLPRPSEPTSKRPWRAFPGGPN